MQVHRSLLYCARNFHNRHGWQSICYLDADDASQNHSQQIKPCRPNIIGHVHANFLRSIRWKRLLYRFLVLYKIRDRVSPVLHSKHWCGQIVHTSVHTGVDFSLIHTYVDFFATLLCNISVDDKYTSVWTISTHLCGWKVHFFVDDNYTLSTH